MPIRRIPGEVRTPVVRDQIGMLNLIEEYRLIPFFVNPIPGYSIEEHTPSEQWFTEDSLGPWDWKIECIQNGDIAYGKYLFGGKAAFATVDVYREIINWRRSQPKYQPTPEQQKVLDYMDENGSISVPETRRLMGINKAAADALLAKLQMQTRVITGFIEREYRGANLKYSGWQRSVFCSPEALFEDVDFPVPGYKPQTLKSSLTPEESLEFLKDTVRKVCGDVPEKLLMKLLG